MVDRLMQLEAPSHALSGLPMPMITLDDCLRTTSIESAALYLTSKIAFNQRRGYVTSYDGGTFWDFGASYERNIRDIYRSIRNRKYVFDPCLKLKRRVKLNKVRDIYISTWRDRIVDRWLNDSLNKLLNEWFSRHSYAYRIEDLGLDSCQDHVAKAISPNSFIAKRDISSYFYSIDHDILLSKIAEIVKPDDYIFDMIRQRIKFRYMEDEVEHVATIGIPFGTSIACTLANVNLTGVDKVISILPVKYFRYADDFLIVSNSPDDTLYAASILDKMVSDLKLSMKPSHSVNISFKEHESFTQVTKFKYLGLEFCHNGVTRLAVEKQRKIINFFIRAIEYVNGKIHRAESINDKLKIAVGAVNEVMTNRIRSVAIIDYYVKHIDDEAQMKMMDRMVAELIIGTVLDKKFRNRDFSTIPFGKLRDMGLTSILHRHRLYAHGHLKSNFMSMHNELVTNRYVSMLSRRKERINHIRMSRKIREANNRVQPSKPLHTLPSC